MPNRILRDWTDSFSIDAAGDAAEVFFVRLLMKVDDYGRFHATPSILKSALFPIREDIRSTDISRRLAACQKAGLIAVYEVPDSGDTRWLSEDELTGPTTAGTKRYLKVVKFKNDPRALSSPFPDPPGETCESYRADYKAQASARKCAHPRADAPVTVTKPNTTVTGTQTGGVGGSKSVVGGVGAGAGNLAGLVKDVFAQSSEVRQFLEAIGLKNPWLTAFAKRDDLTLAIVQGVWRDVQADPIASDKLACLVARLKKKSFAGVKP